MSCLYTWLIIKSEKRQCVTVFMTFCLTVHCILMLAFLVMLDGIFLNLTQISPRMWSLWPLLYQAFKDWAMEYLDNILVPLNNFISKGTEVFLACKSPDYLAQVMLLQSSMAGAMSFEFAQHCRSPCTVRDSTVPSVNTVRACTDGFMPGADTTVHASSSQNLQPVKHMLLLRLLLLLLVHAASAKSIQAKAAK